MKIFAHLAVILLILQSSLFQMEKKDLSEWLETGKGLNEVFKLIVHLIFDYFKTKETRRKILLKLEKGN